MYHLSLLPPRLDQGSKEEKRYEIQKYFNNSFDLFEMMFDFLKDDTVYYKKSEPTRHPMIFYFGHTAVFFVNKLINMKIISQRIDPEMESIFAVGVDEMQWDEMDVYKWPSVQSVREYRNKVRTLVNDLIEDIDFNIPIIEDDPMWIILMGIEHERIHIETSSVLHRQMPLEFIKPNNKFVSCDHYAKAPANELLSIDGGIVKYGRPQGYHLYGWDNEYGEQLEKLKAFEVSKYLVSNEEYLKFVNDGGYEKKEYWSKEGRVFLEKSGAKHPHFWVLLDDGLHLRVLDALVPLPLDWPVEVNALEAEAFCNYISKRDGKNYKLPSEAEYNHIRQMANLADFPEFDVQKANVNFEHYASPCPVDEFGFSLDNGRHIYDLVGNVWQWSRTPIRAFKGFRVHPAYDDFSTPTFDEKHALILGSSFASSGNLLMQHSRYAFRRHFFQHAGFRYVVSENEEHGDDIYESDALVSQYCDFQYGKQYFGVKNFAISCAELAKKYVTNITKALDLGCATGRATFELAKLFDHVDGIDFSARFIGVGTKLQQSGYIAYKKKIEGDLSEEVKVSIKELGFEELRDKVRFLQGDACNLRPNVTGYDLVLATNLIDRLYDPVKFLQDIAHRVNQDGILIITSPYTWQEESTKQELWLGGYVDAQGKEIRTIDRLQELLQGDFELLDLQDIEFVIPESARKFQHTIAQASIWKKKNG